MEEYIRGPKEQKEGVYLATLDAKAAFGDVSYPHLMRKLLYNIGARDDLWTLINDLHTDAFSCVKWNGELSEPFKICQCVRQGGVLSADLYKIYGNDRIIQMKL